MVGGDNVIKKILKSEKGQSMVEFALVVPLLLTILCGIIDMGWAYSNKYSVESAAFSGVRYADIDNEKVTVSVECKVKMLTFVGQTAFGEYYEAKSKNVGAR